MDGKILEQLTALTAEEKEVLGGGGIRTPSEFFIIEGSKLLDGKQMDLRLHTRFVDYPEHGHDYMEFMYVYAGRISHVIGKEVVTLERGDILFLNRHARHSVCMAGLEDIGINFILSNSFLQALSSGVYDNPVMSGFLTRNFEEGQDGEYLFFRTQDNFPIRNLMDNLIYAIVQHSRALYAPLVVMLFTYLAHYRDTLVNALRITSPETQLKMAVSAYIEHRFSDADLSSLARELGYNEAYLSRRIRTLFGKNFQQLLKEIRLKKAEALLTDSDRRVEEIVRAVGYENQSYFHRLFRETYGTTPHQYRLRAKETKG